MRPALDCTYASGLDAVQDSSNVDIQPISDLSLGEFTDFTVTNPPPRPLPYDLYLTIYGFWCAEDEDETTSSAEDAAGHLSDAVA